MAKKVRPGPSAGNKPTGEAGEPASEARPETSKRTGGRPRKWASDAERTKAHRAAKTLRAALDRDTTLAPKLLALARSAGLLDGRPETSDRLENTSDCDSAPAPQATTTINASAPGAVELPVMTEATWPDAMNLLQKAYCALSIVSAPDLSGRERDPYAGAVARIVWEVILATSGAFPELEPLAVVASILSLARHGRPGSPTRDGAARRSDGKDIPDDDLDLVDRCLRVAFGFVSNAVSVYENQVPFWEPGETPVRIRRAFRSLMIKRLERAEHAPVKRKRLAFLRAVDMASRNDAYWSGRGPPVERLIGAYMRSNDVYASRNITPGLARNCIDAWRKADGAHGPSKWEVLAEACNDLGLVGDRSITGRSLKDEFYKAVKAGEAMKPVRVSPGDHDATHRKATELINRFFVTRLELELMSQGDGASKP